MEFLNKYTKDEYLNRKQKVFQRRKIRMAI